MRLQRALLRQKSEMNNSRTAGSLRTMIVVASLITMQLSHLSEILLPASNPQPYLDGMACILTFLLAHNVQVHSFNHQREPVIAT